MKLRIMGLPGEVEQALQAINSVPGFEVIDISGPYPNRGASRLVRVYAEVRISQWCERSWHDGDCCPGSRQEWVARPEIKTQKEIGQ